MMIRDLLSKSIGYSLTAALALSAAVAHATMYRWVDENGSVNYSDQPPANPSNVRRLTVIDEPRITKYEKRSVEIIENEKQRLGDAPTQAPDRAAGGSGKLRYRISATVQPRVRRHGWRVLAVTATGPAQFAARSSPRSLPEKR
jgi:hypothetical protein